MLTNLRIQNFKAWKDTGDLRLAPLTILFGSNSSGKSSLHQLLLMLQQTVQSPDRRRVLHFGDQNTPVDLGSWRSVMHGHKTTAPLEFSFAWKLSNRLDFVDVKTKAEHSVTELAFDCVVRATRTKPPRLFVDRFDYELRNGRADAIRIGMCRTNGGKYDLKHHGYRPIWNVGRKWPLSDPENFHGFPADVAARFQNADFTSDLTLALDDLLDSIVYLGPLREPPGRLYRWSGEQPPHVGWRGERTVDALLAGASRKFNPRPGMKLRGLQEVVAAWLERLGVIESFDVVPISTGRDEYELRVRTPGAAEDVLLTDVGFGVSQVLPVVAQCFYAEPGSTLIFEQPEIHLHPGVQSELANLFVDALRMRESNRPRNLQMIIESHSEHLLRRLLLLIAKDPDLLEHVALYVVGAGENGSEIEPLEVDATGAVRNWPENFFGDALSDIAEQAEIALQRRIAAAL